MIDMHRNENNTMNDDKPAFCSAAVGEKGLFT